MGPMRRLFRLGLGKPSLRQAVDWEIEHYLQEQSDRLVEQGMSPAEARRQAERRFGDVARQRKRMVATDRRRVVMGKRGEFWDASLTGLRQALRGVRRSPGLAVAVVLTLGLGIGVNAAMFGVVDRLLLRAPDHVVQPELVRRVLRDGMFFRERTIISTTTYPDVVDLRTVPEFVSVGATTSRNPLTLGAGEDARHIMVVRATHDFFTTLGVRAHMGRFFDAEDDRLESPLTAVVGYEFWKGPLGGDPGVLGRTLDISGHDMTVIGVAPRGFTGIGLEPVDVWLPAVPAEYAQAGSDRFFNSRSYWWLQAVVRLADADGVESAESQATALHINGREENRRDPSVLILTAPIIEAQGPDASNESKVARWLTGVSLIVLLIACANVANLLLAQGTGRRREVAVRLSLGVTRSRLLREMMLETLMLALLGGVAALALAHWGGGLIRALLIPDILWTASALSGRVVAFTFLLSLAAGMVAGFGPALQSTRADLTRDLAEGGRGSSGKRSWLRGTLTVAQATLSAVLLVGAGLFIQSVIEVRGLDLGLDVDRLVMAQLEFQGQDPDELEAKRAYEEAMDLAAALPGVTGVATTDVIFQWAVVEDLTVPGLDSLPVPPGGGPFYYAVSPGYMGTVGLRVLQGRPILDSDVAGTPGVAVVNEAMARAFWPDRDPLEGCFHIAAAEECTRVVGVVENASRAGLDVADLLAYYVPLAQTGAVPTGLYVRTERDPAQLAATLSPALRSFSPRVRFAQVQTFRELLDPQTRSWTLGASLFTAFGLLALIVAAIGLYSVLAFDVAQRTKEIGIRTALGAPKARVLRGVVLTGARLTVLGVIIGLGVSLGAAPFARDLFFEADGTEPVVLGGVAFVLMVVALIASLVPALRATRVDPMEALRTE
ncbi:MAG TPA: ABC transporter permease [Longimicrobiales bacterium]|nr:ABC transporter permease [Longimicrobiales bacterium]